MSTEAQIEAFKEAITRETQELMALSPEQRFEYVVSIIESIANAIKNILETEGKLNQAKKAEALLNDLNAKAPVLIPPIMYTIKEEFQPVYVNLIKSMAGQ